MRASLRRIRNLDTDMLYATDMLRRHVRSIDCAGTPI